ncbi:MAG TPA: hypothetical protein ENN98_02955 [Desulfurivibrio alkaliphilus]|uniref:Putative zinc-finger domain-containing protein n=1 Tax=Desulfurivibrio alkaliphilus TaxID=427923 RepID=A0A7C2XM24_9BACT|nr:hypothetical protein [Desulfurivibrio alkaliphilus]
MDCSRISSMFTADLDHELDQASRSAFDDHLGSCPACRRQRRLFRATVARVQSLEPLNPPLGILSGIQARLEQPAPADLFGRLAAYWRRLDFSVSLPTAVATVALAMVMAFLAKNEVFFQYQAAPEQAAAVSAAAAPGLERSRLPLHTTIPAAIGRRELASQSPFDTMPTHPPAIRVPVVQRPDVLMVLHAAPPELLSQLFRESAAFTAWRVDYPERELLLVELPSRDLAALREMLVPYPVAVSPVSALSPNYAAHKGRVRVAIRTRLP